MDSPKISVVLPVYQGDGYLSEAIQSILDQTYTDFELLILCDDPSDITRTILDDYQNKDSRVRVFNQQQRLGLVGSLNYGISLATGEYIARMDADDISLPQRFEEQIAYMDSKPEIGICGTWVVVKSEQGESICQYPVDDESIRCELLFNSPLAHPAVFIRRIIFNKNKISYDNTNLHAEDYGFWVLASPFTKFGNIPKALLLYRTHDEAVSRSFANIQSNSADKIRKYQIVSLGIDPTDEELELHRRISEWDFITTPIFIENIEEWFNKILTANARKKIYPEPHFSRIIERRWYSVCCCATGLGTWTWKKYRDSDLTKFYQPTKWQLTKLSLACAIRYSI